MNKFRIVRPILFFGAYLLLVAFISFEIITPQLPLPDDTCFYHTNTPPLWVDLFYLDSSGHTEPPFSLLHMFLILVISIALCFLTERVIRKPIKKK